jgi:signal transduction histidine kinase
VPTDLLSEPASVPIVSLKASDVLDSLPGQVAILDRAGSIVGTNESWVRSLQRRGGSHALCGVGANYLRVCERARDAGDAGGGHVLKGILDVLNGRAPSLTADYTCGLGADDWYEMTVLPLRGSVGGLVISHVSITRRMLAEQETNRLLQELARIERVSLLEQFAAALAHEIRQPLTSLTSNAEAGLLLLNSQTDKRSEIRMILRDICAASSRTSEMIRQMEALILHDVREFRSLDVNEVIADVWTLMQTSAVFRGVEIIFKTLPIPRVIGNRVQIQQVLLNLMYNAAEAMQGTEVAKRELSIETCQEDEAKVRISVSDTGPGVSASDRERIFDAFFTKKTNGMGMGLHISRSLVQAHGGRIWAETPQSGGAKINFTLPVDRP